MRLPLILSVPHAGLNIPPEISEYCSMTPMQVLKDSDEGAAEIYLPLKQSVQSLITTDIARVFVDLNREESNRGEHGVLKHRAITMTPPEHIREALLARYYRPYHQALVSSFGDAVLGIDCHTMLAIGPPEGPMPGQKRPDICLSNADGTCPESWINSLARCLERSFGVKVAINDPFQGGHITRYHGKKKPWVQLELSRGGFATNSEKSEHLLIALTEWCISMQAKTPR